ncbi:hypothetical protein NZD89_27220 [Alicyclobacillus fastidiosus]|uniref:Uncharacterized protein n=1 Tax=Alicyclobacillus fastidiosus TaxID=392011 RepID=A0ABY6ZG58_9BACL|nr:hypothetical protein [Alicyclobacillus fastidiosus]WAH41848.1 hypothetical protein NZD89_27220 [Alicyclobacillus fastidiosus]GMA63552.1 hypothetical protein GCM10025859_39920 [Alicyclobacillus fastidiosus]
MYIATARDGVGHRFKQSVLPILPEGLVECKAECVRGRPSRMQKGLEVADR